jgi:hypothetical protein
MDIFLKLLISEQFSEEDDTPDMRRKIFEAVFDLPVLPTNASEELKALFTQLDETRSNIKNRLNKKQVPINVNQKEDYIPFLKVEKHIRGFIPLELLSLNNDIYYVPLNVYDEANKLQASTFKNFDIKNPLATPFEREITGYEKIRRKHRAEVSVSDEEKKEEKDQVGASRIVTSTYPPVATEADNSCFICSSTITDVTALYKFHYNHTEDTLICAHCLVGEYVNPGRFTQMDINKIVYPECIACKNEGHNRIITPYQVYRVLLTDKERFDAKPEFYKEKVADLNKEIKDFRAALLLEEARYPRNFFDEFVKWYTDDLLKKRNAILENKLEEANTRETINTKLGNIERIVNEIKAYLDDIQPKVPETVHKFIAQAKRMLDTAFSKINPDDSREEKNDFIEELAKKLYTPSGDNPDVLDEGMITAQIKGILGQLGNFKRSIETTQSEIKKTEERESPKLFEKFQNGVQATQERFLNPTIELLRKKKETRNLELNENIASFKNTFQRKIKNFTNQKALNEAKKGVLSEKQKKEYEERKERLKLLKAQKDELLKQYEKELSTLRSKKRSGLYDLIVQREEAIGTVSSTSVGDWSICPYCLTPAQRSEGCQWMYHSNNRGSHFCPGIVSRFTTQKYPMREIQEEGAVGEETDDPNKGGVGWCVMCSAPGNHSHYKKDSGREREPLVAYYDTTSRYGTDTPEITCLKNGGFGEKEFIARKIAIRRKMIELLNSGKRSLDQAAVEEITLDAENAGINIAIYLLQNDNRFHSIYTLAERRERINKYFAIRDPFLEQAERQKQVDEIGELVNRITGTYTVRGEEINKPEDITQVVPLSLAEPKKPEGLSEIDAEIDALMRKQLEVQAETGVAINLSSDKELANIEKGKEIEKLRETLRDYKSLRRTRIGINLDILEGQIQSIQSEIERKLDELEEDTIGREKDIGILGAIYGQYGGAREKGEELFLSLFQRTAYPQELIKEGAETCELPSSTSKQSAGRKNKTLKRKHQKSKKTRGKHFTS